MFIRYLQRKNCPNVNLNLILDTILEQWWTYRNKYQTRPPWNCLALPSSFDTCDEVRTGVVHRVPPHQSEIRRVSGSLEQIIMVTGPRFDMDGLVLEVLHRGDIHVQLFRDP